MPWPLPADEEGRLALAKGYPFAAPGSSYLFAHGRVRPIDEAHFDDRAPVIAHGSNRSPAQLARKFAGYEDRDGEIPVTYGWLSDYDVVYSAHVTSYGAIASNLHHAPGCEVRIAVTWLSQRQLARMHETEGMNYPFGRLSGVALAKEAGPGQRMSEALIYVSRYGCLQHEEAPIGLAAVDNRRRAHRTLTQLEALALVRDRYHLGEELDRHILRNIAEASRRHALIARMAAEAAPSHVPHFTVLGEHSGEHEVQHEVRRESHRWQADGGLDGGPGGG